MRRSGFLGAGALAVFTVVSIGAAGADEFTVDLDALYLARDLPDGVVFSIFEGGAALGDNVALSTNDIDFGYEPGARITLGWEPSAVDRFEASGFWVNHSGEAVTFDPGNAIGLAFNDATNFGGLGSPSQFFSEAFSHTVRLSAEMWNAEANYVRQLTPIEISPLGRFTPSLLGGARTVRFDENFSLVALSSPPTAEESGTLAIETENKLYGLQLGVLGDLEVTPWLSLGVMGKVGFMANDARQETFYAHRDIGSSALTFTRDANDTDYAMLGELGATADFTITSNVSFALGYNAIQLSGVALAAHQFPRAATFDSFEQLNQDGSALYHGGTARLTIRTGAVEQWARSGALGAATLPVASDGAADTDRFTLDLDALYLARDLPDGVVFSVFVGGAAAGDNVALSTNDINFGYEPGARTTLGWEPSAVDRFEVSGFWVEHDGEAVTFDPDLSISLAFNRSNSNFSGQAGTGTFFNVFSHTVRLGAEMWNAEANYVRRLSPVGRFTPSVLGGVRTVRLDEYFSLVSFDNENPAATDIGTLSIETENKLYGLQLGGGGDLQVTPWLSLGVMGKVGFMANDASQETFYSNPSLAFPQTFTRDANDTDYAMLGELAATADFAITSNVSFSLGYNLIQLSGVALAAHQFPRAATFDSFEQLNQDGSALYHGGTARLTMKLP